MDRAERDKRVAEINARQEEIINLRDALKEEFDRLHSELLRLYSGQPVPPAQKP